MRYVGSHKALAREIRKQGCPELVCKEEREGSVTVIFFVQGERLQRGEELWQAFWERKYGRDSL